MLCAFRTFCNSWNSFLYANSHRRAIYFWKQDSQSRHRTSKHHWRACGSSTFYSVSASNLSNRWFSEWIQLQLAALSLPCDSTIMRFIFQFAFLHLQLQGFSTSASPRNQACVTRPSPLVGGVWSWDYLLEWLLYKYSCDWILHCVEILKCFALCSKVLLPCWTNCCVEGLQILFLHVWSMRPVQNVTFTSLISHNSTTFL